MHMKLLWYYVNHQKLSTVTFKSNCKKISYGSFDGCKSLTNITLLQNIEKIDIAAFNAC